VAFDASSSYFDYKNMIFGGGLGYFSASNGFLDLTLNGGAKGSGGYAVEIPGRAALLRPGDNTTFPVAAVETDGCPDLSTGSTFQFITFALPLGSFRADATSYGAYGSVKITTQGLTWNFSDLTMFGFDGTNLSPAPIPSGTCGFTQEGYVANVPPSSQTGNFPITAAVGPSGFFILDEGQLPRQILATAFKPVPPVTPTWPFGLVGVPQPAAPLDTGSIVAGKYAGFEFSPLGNTLAGTGTVFLPATQPVFFGTAAGSGTVLTGGGFPGDDATKVPDSNITIDLGQQDPMKNGLYKSVVVTIPDQIAACVSRPYGGTDSKGNPTCIFHGAAIAGNPEGKFAVFVAVDDLRNATFKFTGTTALEFLLYQQ
jgi:hypothetical protein